MDEAIVHYQKALQLHPQSADIHANLGIALLTKGRVRDAMAEYTKALQISPENLAALSNLAWLLATSADGSLRNGSEACACRARRIGEFQERQSPDSSPDCSCSLRRSRPVSEAKETAQKALETANIQGNTVLADELQGELCALRVGFTIPQIKSTQRRNCAARHSSPR